MHKTTLLAAALLLSLAGAPPARADETMRCSTGRLVRVGDRMLELREVCGAPAQADRRVAYRELEGRRGDVHRAVEVAERLVVPITIDEWLYDLGPGRFLRRLVFENGRLVRIDSLARSRS